MDLNPDLSEGWRPVWYMHGAGWGWWLLMSVGMVAFWAGIIYLVLWLVRGARPLRGQEPGDVPSETPLALLQRRLAAGEIGIDEYNERRKALGDDSPRPAAHAAG